ncbi:CRACD-like protein isoform X2 [Hyperolius riggenbachi]
MDSRDGDNFIEDHSAKKKFKFKSFKKLFGIKKRKETLPSLGNSGLKQSQSASDVTIPESIPNEYDSEDDVVAEATVLGSRAVSHDSIFIPEVVQEPTRPARVFSQENVSDRIKALQLKVQSNIKIGPPPFGLMSKRIEDPGTSSEDDGLPRSPPEMSLLHDAIRSRGSDIHRHHSALSLGGTGSEDEQISSDTSSRPLSPEESERHGASSFSQERRDSDTISPTLLSPSADFSTPAQPSTFLDNSAARHRLSVRPRNQRASQARRPSAAFQEDSEGRLNSMEEEDTTAPSLETADDNADILNHKNVPKITDSSPGIDSISIKFVEDKSELTTEREPQTPVEMQKPSLEVGTDTTKNLQSGNIARASATVLREEIKVSEEPIGRSKPNKKTSSDVVTIVKDVGPISPLPSPEKPLIKNVNAPGNSNEKSSNSQQTPVPVSRTTTPSSHSQETPLSRSRALRLSMSERSQNTPEQSLSDKENKKSGSSVDKKDESSPTETSTQRKFSVSSAWERPRTNSFTQKAHAEGDVLKNTKLSILKPGVSRTETMKEDKSAAVHSDIKPSGRKKEALADPETSPSEKAISSNITSNQSAVPTASDLSVTTDSQAATEDKNPFVKLRPTSLSSRNRDGINPVSTTVKRHSAELKQEKTVCLPSSKDEISETGPTDLPVSPKSDMKCKTDSAEVPQAKPPLPRKPVLQNITVSDNNLNKEEAENNFTEEKKSKSPELKPEVKIPERRQSVHKTIE